MLKDVECQNRTCGEMGARDKYGAALEGRDGARTRDALTAQSLSERCTTRAQRNTSLLVRMRTLKMP